MVEDVAPTLHALIQPARPMLLLLDRYGECLASAIVDRINEGHVELIRVFCQVVSAGHACGERASAEWQYLGTSSNSPAAPAPTIKTLFFFGLSTLGAMVKRVEEAVRDCNKDSEDCRIALGVRCYGGSMIIAREEEQRGRGSVRRERNVNVPSPGYRLGHCVMTWVGANCGDRVGKHRPFSPSVASIDTAGVRSKARLTSTLKPYKCRIPS